MSPDSNPDVKNLQIQLADKMMELFDIDYTVSPLYQRRPSGYW